MFVKLKELLTIKNGSDYKHLSRGKIPVIGTGGVMLYVDKFLYDKETILLPRKGSLNNIMYVDKPFWTVDTMFYAIPNQEKVNAKYLYYHLSLINFARLDVGSTIPSMTASLYYSLIIDLPTLEIQNKIASILSSLDSQISRNDTMVKRLQVLAHNIFFYYYSNYEKQLIKLKDIAKMYQPETITGNDFVKNGQYFVYGSGGIIGKYNKYNHKDSELMISCRGKCGNIALSLPYSWIIGNQMVIKPLKSQLKYYLYNYFQIINLNKIETGSVQKQITRANLENLDIRLVNDDVLFALGKKLSPIYKKINDIYELNEQLKAFKSKMLPLLINQQLG